MKRNFIVMPMMLPTLSDRAAVQLLDILEQLQACLRHHYAPQVHRWQRRQCSVRSPCRPPCRPSPALFDDELPF